MQVGPKKTVTRLLESIFFSFFNNNYKNMYERRSLGGT